jgi:large subunit ribosomal protein L4
MAKVKVYNAEGEVIEELDVELDESLSEKGEEALAQSLIRQAANARRPYAHAKTRSEVSGGGAKPWRQKGTGRARHGSRRSPIFVGGGKAFGPRNERNFSIRMNKKERRLAMRKALYHAIVDGRIAVLDSLAIDKPSTKRGVKLFSDIGLDGKILFVHSFTDHAVLKSFSNIPKLTMYDASRINAYDLLAFDHILCAREEFDKVRERWLN